MCGERRAARALSTLRSAGRATSRDAASRGARNASTSFSMPWRPSASRKSAAAAHPASLHASGALINRFLSCVSPISGVEGKRREKTVIHAKQKHSNLSPAGSRQLAPPTAYSSSSPGRGAGMQSSQSGAHSGSMHRAFGRGSEETATGST